MVDFAKSHRLESKATREEGGNGRPGKREFHRHDGNG